MQFNFKKTYASFTNIELLKILHEPHKYQPDAIAAAEEILSSKVVTEEEKTTALAEIEAEKKKAEKQKEPFLKAKAIAGDTIEDFINPIKEKTLAREITLFCLGLLLIYPFIAWSPIKFIIGMFRCYDCVWSLYEIELLAELLLLPIGIYLFYKHRTWGWVLLFGYFIYLFLNCLPWIDSLIHVYSYGHNERWYVNKEQAILFRLLFNVALILYLSRKSIRDLFNISKTLLLRTIMSAVTITLLIYIINTMFKLA